MTSKRNINTFFVDDTYIKLLIQDYIRDDIVTNPFQNKLLCPCIISANSKDHLLFSLRQPARRTTIDSFDNNSASENDAQSDSYTIDIPEEVENEAIFDNENLTDSEGESDDGGSSTENESSVNFDDEVEEDVDSECAENDDEQVAQPNNVRYLVFQLIKRIRACIANIRATRVVNDSIKIKAQSNDLSIKSRLITDFEVRWNTTL